MKRSVWKVPYVSPFFFSKKKLEEKEVIKTKIRKTIITQYIFKKRFLVYAGRL